MKTIVENLLSNRHRTIPILSFPSTQLLGISVQELIASSDRQAEGMQAIANRCAVGASLNMMDLSVEAEAFGAQVRFYENEIPAVEKGIIEDIDQAGSICVPPVGAGRTQLYIDGVRKAKERITDLPVFCGIIGPYSLAGRLFDLTELMMTCYDDPDGVKILLAKATAFLKDYLQAFKAAGADGVIMAEPAAGMLSPSLAEEFSMPFVQEIFDAVDDPNFVICYHNCGNAVADMLPAVSQLHADIFHFGNAINLQKVLLAMPADKVIMGNVDPVLLQTGTTEDVKRAVRNAYDCCGRYDNFMISSGCDIPAAASWENIDAYFETVKELYG